MSLRNIRHWMNDARRRGYAGPTEAAILTKQGEVVSVPDMRDWQGTHTALGTVKPEDVAATFIKAPKGGWCGEAQVPGLRGTQTLYSRDHGDDRWTSVTRRPASTRCWPPTTGTRGPRMPLVSQWLGITTGCRSWT